MEEVRDGGEEVEGGRNAQPEEGRGQRGGHRVRTVDAGAGLPEVRQKNILCSEEKIDRVNYSLVSAWFGAPLL